VQKTAEPIEMPFGISTRVDQMTHVLDGVDIGATWQIRLNRPYAAVIRPYAKLLWPLVVVNCVRYMQYLCTPRVFG